MDLSKITHYLDNSNKIIKFKSEIEPQLINVTSKIYYKYFPKLSKINYSLLQISNIGLYSIALPKISYKICKKIIKKLGVNIVITDALANVGGMTLMFAHYFNKVNSCEIIKKHADILRNNVDVYKFKNVKIYNDDYFNVMFKLKQDVIFFDPPWGGTNYKNTSDIHLGINNVNIVDIINLLLPYTKYIVMRTPNNYNHNFLLKYLNTTSKIDIYKFNTNEYSQYLYFIKGHL